MSSVCPDWTLGEIAGAMREHGYTGFEPRVEWGHLCGIEAGPACGGRRETRDLLASEGLEICCLATGVRMAEPDASERARHIEDLRRYLDLAADLGCGLVRTFGGRRDRDAEWPAVVDYVAAGYGLVVDQARDAGVTLLLETHDDWSATAPVRAVIEAVDDPGLQVLWDFMHPQRMMETPAESFLAVGHAHPPHPRPRRPLRRWQAAAARPPRRRARSTIPAPCSCCAAPASKGTCRSR